MGWIDELKLAVLGAAICVAMLLQLAGQV